MIVTGITYPTKIRREGTEGIRMKIFKKEPRPLVEQPPKPWPIKIVKQKRLKKKPTKRIKVTKEQFNEGHRCHPFEPCGNCEDKVMCRLITRVEVGDIIEIVGEPEEDKMDWSNTAISVRATKNDRESG